jgi:hypothetical protein
MSCRAGDGIGKSGNRSKRIFRRVPFPAPLGPEMTKSIPLFLLAIVPSHFEAMGEVSG